jgi:hypothetical protein
MAGETEQKDFAANTDAPARSFRLSPSPNRSGGGTLKTEDTTPSGAWLAIVGGGLMAIGVILPWITATAALGISISRDGFQLGNDDALTFDGPVLLLLGIVTIVIGVSRLTNTAPPRFLQRSSIVTGIVAAAVLINRYSGIHDLVNQVNSSSSALASIGYGFWVCSAGALAAFVGGLVLRAAKRQEETVTP